MTELRCILFLKFSKRAGVSTVIVVFLKLFYDTPARATSKFNIKTKYFIRIFTIAYLSQLRNIWFEL